MFSYSNSFVRATGLFCKFLSLQGDTPTFCFKVLYHRPGSLLACYINTDKWLQKLIWRHPPISYNDGLWTTPISLKVLNEILASKISILCWYNTYSCLTLHQMRISCLTPTFKASWSNGVFSMTFVLYLKIALESKDFNTIQTCF